MAHGALPRAVLIVGLALGGLVGCDDEHEIIHDGVGEDAGSLDPEPDPHRPPAADAGPTDGRALPETPPPANGGPGGDPDGDEGDEERDPDHDPEDPPEPEAPEPDPYEPVEDPELDPGLGLPDEEPEDPGGLDGEPEPIEMPGCGLFGPAAALAAGPTVTATFHHGSPALRFGEPALAGCTPSRLWGGDPARFWQDVTFDYGWGRVLSWVWHIHTPDGGSTRLPGEVQYDGTGRVTDTRRRCPWTPADETQSFGYDRMGRLVQVDIDRPAECEPHAAAERRTVVYRYADADDPLPVARTVTVGLLDGHSLVDVRLVYGRDEAGRVVEIREEIEPFARGTVQRFEYDDAGRIVRKTEQLGGLDAERQRVTTYAYDDRGRLVERQTGEQILRIGYDAAGGLEWVVQSNPPALVEMDFPDPTRFVPLARGADPADRVQDQIPRP